MLHSSLLLLLLVFQNDAKPLPDKQSFLAELRKSLHTDSVLLSTYTYTEKRTTIRLDSSGKPKDTEVNAFQVFPGSCERLGYRRQIVKDGVSVPQKELEKQDREHQKKVESGARGGGDRRGRPFQGQRGGSCQNNANDEKIIDDLFGVYDIQMLGREDIAGHAAVLVSFKPRSSYKPQTRQGEILKHVAGRAWVSEDDHQLARVDAEVIDDVSIGFGILAKLKKGTRIVAERQKFNDEIWLPSRTEVSLAARVIFKGYNLRQIVEYSEHKKFSVDTKLNFSEEVEQSQPRP